MFVALDILETEPKAELYFDRMNEEYELHVPVDGGMLVLSVKHTNTILDLAKEMQDSLYRLPDPNEFCEEHLDHAEVVNEYDE